MCDRLASAYRCVEAIPDVWLRVAQTAPKTVLQMPLEGEEVLTPVKQAQYCSGVGEGMHMMQYSRPEARHIQCCSQFDEIIDTCNTSS